ncbi:MAG: hypothetical protein JWN98_2280 [Abditibacteriota bacterium]|nr:hypothetical protein [Abditibacteriota bacterium]
MKVLSLPAHSHIALMFRPERWDELVCEFEITTNPNASQKTPGEVSGVLPEYDAVLTGWGSPAFERTAIEKAPNLKLIAHTAGSVKGLFSDDTVREVLLPRGIQVFSGNDAIALNVAEATIGLMIATARRWIEHSKYFGEQRKRNAAWPNNSQFLTGATVGLVSASKVARHVIRVLQPFNCRILVFDPFLSREAARTLGVEKCELNELFQRSDIVSLHAPKLPQTKGMIGAAQLALLRDGATFINTSRGDVVDHEALLAECRSGRIVAALDVTEPEPLPAESPFWKLPNVLLTPHVAGAGREGYFRLGDATLQALRDVRANRPLAGAAPLQNWETLA